jgi:chromosome segregation ATPase
MTHPQPAGTVTPAHSRNTGVYSLGGVAEQDVKAVRITELRKLLMESEAERSELEARASRLEAERDELEQQCEALRGQVGIHLAVLGLCC